MRKTCLNCVYEIAKEDERVLFIGSDLGPGVLDIFKKNIPDRFFMEGIAEQHIIGMAAGLAMDGFIPYVNTIATFLTRRCFEQVALDLCLHDLPVRLIGNGGGLVYAPLGPTHQAIEDIAILRTLPNMTVVAPCDADEMRRLMTQTTTWPHPIYIRLAKGGDPIISRDEDEFEIGKGILLAEASDVLFVSTGITTQNAMKALSKLAQVGIRCGVLHMHTIKPFDQRTLLDAISDVKLIVTVEEHVLNGGLGSAVLESLAQEGVFKKVIRVGINDVFPEKYGSQEDLMESYGLDTSSLVRVVEQQLN